MVLSNCAIDAVSLYPTYRKPFDLIFQKAKTEGWLPELYDLRTFRFEFSIEFRKVRALASGAICRSSI